MSTTFSQAGKGIGMFPGALFSMAGGKHLISEGLQQIISRGSKP